MEQINEVSREIEGLKLENEVFRNYLERQIQEKLRQRDSMIEPI